MSRAGLWHYPGVREILESIAERQGRPKSAREHEILPHVLAAIEQLESSGERVTQSAVSRIVGMSVAGLIHYPRVRKILEGISENWKKPAGGDNEDAEVPSDE